MTLPSIKRAWRTAMRTLGCTDLLRSDAAAYGCVTARDGDFEDWTWKHVAIGMYDKARRARHEVAASMQLDGYSITRVTSAERNHGRGR